MLFLIPEIVKCKLPLILFPYTELSCSLNINTSLRFFTSLELCKAGQSRQATKLYTVQ